MHRRGQLGQFLEVCLGQRIELREPSLGEHDPHDAFAARAPGRRLTSPSATALEREVEPGAEVQRGGPGEVHQPGAGPEVEELERAQTKA
jgi:hypothetical protein